MIAPATPHILAVMAEYIRLQVEVHTCYSHHFPRARRGKVEARGVL
ncbi:hypothetical protein ACJ72_06677 [Emergomyces africanus]|uniref:Uncharacterized protein n=1 Tax=Emergomyces africanus TaxID=1955775 RepID=A0A1B7NQF7_9EURO|nr:hypothetical protein ACJ72_06677 [Emergomyces africanus]